MAKNDKWILKNRNPTTCSLQETHFRYKDTNELRVKELKRIFHKNVSERESLKVDKIDKTKIVTRDKDNVY